jgi:hypothetical protein
MIQTGDMLTVAGRPALATSKVYTKMHYDAYDYELMHSGFEGGTARGVVDVVYTETGHKTTVALSEVVRVLPAS